MERFFVAVGPFLGPEPQVARIYCILLSCGISPDIGKCALPKLKVRFFEKKSSKKALWGVAHSRYIFYHDF